LSRPYFTKPGNDTIDCSPLLERGIKKILIVSEQKFKELEKEFGLFFQGLRDRLSQRSSLPEATRGPISRSQEPSAAPDLKIDSEDLTQHYRDYEPTNAIYTNSSEYRRWCRVSEWFNQFSPDAEIFKRSLLIK